MAFPKLARYADLALLLLRFMVGVVFAISGWRHSTDPAGRSKSIGMSKGFAAFLGTAEIAGSLDILARVLAQLAAIGLILVMLGAIQKTIFVWHTGFWGKDGYGWHHDLMLVTMNLVIVATGGGKIALMR